MIMAMLSPKADAQKTVSTGVCAPGTTGQQDRDSAASWALSQRLIGFSGLPPSQGTALKT